MARPNEKTKRSAEVVIVAKSAETLDGLHTYLNTAGVSAKCTSDIDEIRRDPAQRPSAFVLFPDDFAWDRVVAAVAAVLEQHPAALPIVVTAHPKRIEELTRESRVLVVPRPVWGWTILDAVRAHCEDHERASE